MSTRTLPRPLSFLSPGLRKLSNSGVSSGIEQVQALRVIIGLMGIFLPTVLLLGDWAFLAGSARPRGSVSSYYYSGMRDVFVGTMVAIGVVLVTYRIRDRHPENVLSTVAGVSALVVAIFPTKRPSGLSVDITELQKLLGETLVSNVHLGAGIAFIGAVSIIGLLFALRETGWLRVGLFWCVAGIMLSLVACLIAFFLDDYLLFGEAGVILFFGVSWLAKGINQ